MTFICLYFVPLNGINFPSQFLGENTLMNIFIEVSFCRIFCCWIWILKLCPKPIWMKTRFCFYVFGKFTEYCLLWGLVFSDTLQSVGNTSLINNERLNSSEFEGTTVFLSTSMTLCCCEIYVCLDIKAWFLKPDERVCSFIVPSSI